MNRRDFLTGVACVTSAVMPVVRKANAQDPQGQAPPLDWGKPAAVSSAKLARVSIMAYNFTSMLRLEGQAPSPSRDLDLFDLPRMFAESYGVHNIEVQHSHFASAETSYLKDFLERVENAKSNITQINVEFGQMTISAADPVQREQAIDLTARWVDHATILKCPRVMINQGQLTPETMAKAEVALRRMSENAMTKGVKIAVETRVVAQTGASSRLPLSAPDGPPAWELVKELVEQTKTYSNVDIGNVMAPDQASLEMVIKGLLRTSSGNMHIKLSPSWDLGKVIRFTNNELGYQGLYSIEVAPPLIRGVYETILANI